MVPTTYSGNAIIDGERLPAVLHLGAETVLLEIETQEVLRWPIDSLDVEPVKQGSYELKHGPDKFTFQPAVDDGLHEELELRRRFSGTTPPAAAEREEAAKATGSTPRRMDRSGLLSILDGRDLRPRTALLVVAALAVVVLGVAAYSGVFEAPPSTVVVDTSLEELSDAPESTVPPTTAAAPVTTISAPPTTAVAPTVSAATVTTQPPSTTIAPETGPTAGRAFDMTPEQFVAAWDALAGSITSSLRATGVSLEGDKLSFAIGEFARLEGTAGPEGNLNRLVVTGDPSGSVEDDREILTALGATIALAEPDLPPEGRRELLESLGLDIENPELDGLDGKLQYRGLSYSLRWDPDSARLVLEVSPADG